MSGKTGVTQAGVIASEPLSSRGGTGRENVGVAAGAAPLDPWQPISTAPKDGLVIMGWGDYRERDGFSPAFMRWSDLAQSWSVNSMPFYPTHWQPLPAGPGERARVNTVEPPYPFGNRP